MAAWLQVWSSLERHFIMPPHEGVGYTPAKVGQEGTPGRCRYWPAASSEAFGRGRSFWSPSL